MTKETQHWRSLDHLARTPRYLQALEHEFPPEAAELEIPTVGRRGFIGLLGASTALAGATLTGCVRKPREQILPYARRPEDLVPGNPRYYATSACIAGQVEGLLVESQDGRPTKIEGNPNHPMSRGATSVWAQAEILSLYDPERSRKPMRRGKSATWGQWDRFASEHFDTLARRKGQGLAVITLHLPGPTLASLFDRFFSRFPAARYYRHDMAAMALAPPLLMLDRARVVLALDADMLGSEDHVVHNARGFSAGRRPDATTNRLYVVEPFFSVTGTLADHRLQLRASEVAGFLGALTAELLRRGLTIAGGEKLRGRLPSTHRFGKWIPAVAADLLAARGKGAIVAGQRQPAPVHTLVWALNHALDNVSTLDAPRPVFHAAGQGTRAPAPLSDLARELGKGRIDTLVIIGANPSYSGPVDLDLDRLMRKVPETIHLGLHRDETGHGCSWHLPGSHFLEAWGDWRAADGTVGIQQPLIAPLHATRSELELMAQLAGVRGRRGYELVHDHWRSSPTGGTADFSAIWRRWLHDGVATEVSALAPAGPPAMDNLLHAWPPAAPAGGGLELTFRPCPKLYDGRYANNGWLQELPDPVTKLTWDNAACISPRTATRLGIKPFDQVQLTCDGRSMQIAAFVVPGTADDAVVVSLGYGRREGGTVLSHAGFDTYQLRTSNSPWFKRGASLKKVGQRYLLASTQDHGSMEGRPLIREGTLAQLAAEPRFAEKAAPHPLLESIWTPPNPTDGQQWGMSIDLNLCTGCNACVVACQAENNIPVVGKRRVLEGREMHWIRLDRYFTGPAEEARSMAVQPMACHHCELAPCESVCPVAATVHSPEGLNDMAYNRCIGTRYCSNNCPYKVRRFNFFQYNKGIDPVARMQKNPDVTLRFRGVMEKCTFCVQRINEAKIAAKRDGNGVVADGAIVPACAQACPTRAIVFGDTNDPKSGVSRRKAESRDYAVLAELNIRPRLTYLARLRNPNPELG